MHRIDCTSIPLQIGYPPGQLVRGDGKQCPLDPVGDRSKLVAIGDFGSLL
jgi:hypothetical protein